MPVDVAVKEPGSGVISGETDSNVVGASTSVDDVTNDRVNIVVSGLTSTADHVEIVLGEVNIVSLGHGKRRLKGNLHRANGRDEDHRSHPLQG